MENSGEMLCSLLTLWSPTRVTDDTGDTDVKVEAAAASVGNSRFISGGGELSNFRRLGVGTSTVGIDDIDGKLPNLGAI